MNFKVDPEIISGFVKEVESYLPKLVQSLEEFRANPENVDSLEEAYRMVHCIRGAGSTIGLMALSQMAQYQEDTLEQILSGQLRWSDDVAGVLASATLRIGEYLHGITSGDLHECAIVTELVKAFRRMRNLPESGDAEEIRNLLGESPEPEQIAEESVPDFAQMEPEILSFETIEDLMPADEPAKMEAPATEAFAEPELVIQTLDEFQVDDDLWSAFQEEAAEHFEKLAAGLAALEASDDVDTLKTIRRSVHQLKGASGVVGMRATSKINAAMQKVLDRIFEGEAKYTRDLLPLFQRAFEVVLESIGGKGTGANLADRAKEIQAEFDEILSLPVLPPATPVVPPSPSPAANGPKDQMDVGDDLLEAFHQEAEEHLHVIGELFRNMERESPNPEQIQAMRRAVHTFKGACGVVGLRLTSSVAHRMEDLLDAMYEGRVAYRTELAPLLFSTYDILTDAVANRGISAAQRGKLDALFMGYEAALAGAKPQAVPGEPGTMAGEAPKPVLVPSPQEPRKSVVQTAEPEPPQRKSAQFVRAPLERVDELVRLVSELVIHRSRFEQHLSGYVHEVNELQLSIERLSRVSRKFQSDYEATALQEANRRAFTAIGRGFSPAGSAAADDFDALEFDRYTEFHLLSRDLAETTGDVSNAGSRLNDLIADFDSYLNRLSTLTGEVEDRLMRLRMLPLRHLSSRLHRTVRVTAERRNKLVDLVVDGEAVELDKTVLEEMAGPLDHILRNAVDHGIEPAALRRAAGKPERGAIYLRAYHEGTQVVLQIRDDGGGLDVRRLREAAVSMGYVSPEDAPNLSDQELYGIIFLPGFSTASEVSEVSGRGVGLDVVKATVNKMKGTLSIQSERGKGTAFTIRLPMTLALTRVVLVRSGMETYAVPLAAISQIVRIEPEQLERVGRKPVLRLGGRILPTLHLAEVVGQQLPPDANLTRLKAIVLNIGDQRLALMVDTVLEAREVVVKTLGSLLGRVHAVTGATIMGDGSVVLILNPNDMLHAQHAVTPQVRLRTTGQTKPASEALEVLIVDDSPSVRRVLTNLIRNAGWKPHSAKDGLEALEMLHSGVTRPDILLLDIEMPRMDGYELTAALRGMPNFKHTPIVMLTSRAGEKHRKRAFELGASDYMVKPYQDEELLSVVRRAVHQTRGVAR
ncbi:MAG: Hpt domain-containing protein [Bryobacterales bacterium]|nr:Hpt domain-containing protein [Bryobacterales bacterium]